MHDFRRQRTTPDHRRSRRPMQDLELQQRPLLARAQQGEQGRGGRRQVLQDQQQRVHHQRRMGQVDQHLRGRHHGRPRLGRSNTTLERRHRKSE